MAWVIARARHLVSQGNSRVTARMESGLVLVSWVGLLFVIGGLAISRRENRLPVVFHANHGPIFLLCLSHQRIAERSNL
jgi:hypothetical protein